MNRHFKSPSNCPGACSSNTLKERTWWNELNSGCQNCHDCYYSISNANNNIFQVLETTPTTPHCKRQQQIKPRKQIRSQGFQIPQLATKTPAQRSNSFPPVPKVWIRLQSKGPAVLFLSSHFIPSEPLCINCLLFVCVCRLSISYSPMVLM